MFGLGTTELLLIVAVLFLLFGATKLPQLARSIGQSKKAFKDGLEESEREDRIESQKRPPVISDAAVPQLTGMSDEELLAEMHRRAEVKQL